VVYLTGTTRTREGKRRIEHMADIEGVADVVNGLRVREPEQRRNMFGF
jgi:osmotically-inducible protein OsmY